MTMRMRVRGWICGVLLLGGVGAPAQQPGDGAPAATVGAELRGLASQAGVVFVGQVTKIEPKDGVVEITFAVALPVLGVVGGSYVMREWAGRWTGGRQDFQVGQRAMFFLHAANAAGLSSAVDGMTGAVPVVPMGPSGAALLDVRWVAARVQRPVGAPLAGAGMGAIALVEGVAVAKSWATDVTEPKLVQLPEGVIGVAEGPVQGQRPGPGQGPVVGRFPFKEALDAQH